MTPPLPDFVRSYRLTGYRSIYELVPSETRLYGTESLYGDWQGRLLVLAKDFACSELVRKRIKGIDPRPYRHEPRLRTNIRLQRLVGDLAAGPDPARCGVLYGSAAACLLRDDGHMSGRLPHRHAMLQFGARVLRWVREQMGSLRAIMCLGEEAWLCASGALRVTDSWADCRDSARPAVTWDGICLVAAYHPAARMGGDAHAAAWTLLRSRLAD
jgi:hypothetical protein